MTDCLNAEMRDRLPDLLHERLDASARAAVMAHVEECADCRVELIVLREARVALTSGMRSVDVAAIARVVITRTSSPAVVRGPEPRARSTWINWRVAASIAVLVAGGASFAVIRARQQLTVGPRLPVVASPAPESVPVRIARTPATGKANSATPQTIDKRPAMTNPPTRTSWLRTANARPSSASPVLTAQAPIKR
jgi:hypothetical protein